MVKYVLTPNPNPPHNLIRISLPYESENLHFETEGDMLQFVVQRNQEVGLIAANSPYWVVDETELPGGAVNEENDYFFEGWEWDEITNKVVVTMPKARIIHMDRIRVVRNAELVKLDVPFMRAVEAGDTSAQATIGTEKQVLRDIPATFDITTGVTTPVQLKAKWPTELPARE